MKLNKLIIKNFRNFYDLMIEFNDGINLITGMNGQGKTSILESIYYLALTKSFRTVNDKNSINNQNEFFNISGNFTNQSSGIENIRVYFSKKEGKNVFFNGSKVLKFSDYIGKIPCIVLTLEDLKLVQGTPGIRRKFLDILLSQVSPVYLENLKRLKKTILHRNMLLMSENVFNKKNQIDIWNRQLVEHGSQIIEKRLEVVSFLNSNISEYYNKFSKTEEENLSIKYDASIGTNINNLSIEDIKKIFHKKIDYSFKYEIEKGKTIIGPHRDDLIFNKNNNSLKEFASQGEIKTFIIAIKLLEWKYVNTQRNIKPILLLDDIFGELDETRINGLLFFLKRNGQIFITTTLNDKFDNSMVNNKITVKNKKIYYARK